MWQAVSGRVMDPLLLLHYSQLVMSVNCDKNYDPNIIHIIAYELLKKIRYGSFLLFKVISNSYWYKTIYFHL